MGSKKMTKTSLAMLLVGLMWLLGGGVLWPLSAYAEGNVPGYVLVRLLDANDVDTIDNDYSTVTEDYIPNTGLYSLRTPAGSTETEFALQLRQDSRVAWAEPDTYLNPPEVNGEQFHFAFDAGPNPGCYFNPQAFAQVHLGCAQSMTSGTDVVVAVLDTGATFDHPALRGHYLEGYNVLQPDAPACDVPDGLLNRAVGHGTMIAGVIARVAPGAKILPVRVLNGDGYGTVLDVAKGIDYAIHSGARVLNMSFGATHQSQALEEALREAKDASVVIVASAGNDASSIPHFPAASENVMAVASVEANYVKSSYSNFGDYISVVAPGTGIRSTYCTGGYANWSGTSFAVPFIAAEAALLLSRRPGLSSQETQGLIRGTARSVDEFNPQYLDLLGNGLVDIEAAVKSVP